MHFFLGNRKLVKADEDSAAEGLEGLAAAVDSGMSADDIGGALASANSSASKLYALISTSTSMQDGVDTTYKFINNQDKILASPNLNIETYSYTTARLKTATGPSGKGDIAEVGGEGAYQTYASYSIMTDEKKVSFHVGGNATVRVRVRDGVNESVQLDDTYGVPSGGSSGQYQGYLNIEFDTRELRVIECQLNAGQYNFDGVVLHSSAQFSKPPQRTTVAYTGDSFGYGVIPNGNIAGVSVSALLTDAINCDCMNSSLGGTGFIAQNSTYNYLDRVQDMIDSVSNGAEYIFAHGSINDVGQDPTSNFNSWLAAIRAEHATVPIVVFGIPAAHSSSRELVEQYLSDAVTAAADDNLYFIPVMTDACPPVTGSGYEGAEAGDGNADLYIGSDGTHFNKAGYEFYSNWLKVKSYSTLKSIGLY